MRHVITSIKNPCFTLRKVQIPNLVPFWSYSVQEREGTHGQGQAYNLPIFSNISDLNAYQIDLALYLDTYRVEVSL